MKDNAALQMLDDTTRRGETLDLERPSNRQGYGKSASPVPLDENAMSVRQRRAWARRVAAEPRLPGCLNQTERELLARLVRLGLAVCPDELQNVRTGQVWRHERVIMKRVG